MVLTGYSGVAARVPRDYLRGTPMELPGDCTHARGPRAKLEGFASALEGYSVGYYLPRGSWGQYYTAGHSMQRTPGSSRRYSRGTQGGSGAGTQGVR